MFESGYFLNSISEWILNEPVSHPTPVLGEDTSKNTDPNSFLGKLIEGAVKYSNASSSGETSLHLASMGDFLLSSRVLFLLAFFWLIAPLVIQTIIGCTLCNSRGRISHRARSKCLNFLFWIFLLIWILLCLCLISSVIFYANHFNIIHGQKQNTTSFLDRVELVNSRLYAFLRGSVKDSVLIINTLLSNILEDLYNTIVDEVPEITNQFIKETRLESPLQILASLSQVVEDLLSSHKFLREQGPVLSSEMEKLDSILKINGRFLTSAVDDVKLACSNSPQLPDSFDKFSELVAELSSGLHETTLSSQSFFKQFRLESSLGLFNMLSMLPFNVSEVLTQLKSATEIRLELENSIYRKTKLMFQHLKSTDSSASRTELLRSYTSKVLDILNSVFYNSQNSLNIIKPKLGILSNAKLLLYVLLFSTLTVPILLTLSNCSYGERSRLGRFHSSKFTKEPQLLVSSSSENTDITLTTNSDSISIDIPNFIPRNDCTDTSESGNLVIDLSRCLEIYEDQNLDIKNSEEKSKLLDVINVKTTYAADKLDTKEAWLRTDTLDSLRNKVTSDRSGCSCGRRFNGFLCILTSWSLFFLGLISVILMLGSGFLHVNVCLPLCEDTKRELLDNEVNFIIDRNSDSWLSYAQDTLLNYLPTSDDRFTSLREEFRLQDFIQIQPPRNIISSILENCTSQAHRKGANLSDMSHASLYRVLQMSIQHNLSRLIDLKAIRIYTGEFRRTFIKESVDLIEEKLADGILPSNFELLLQKLHEEFAHGKGTSHVLSTAERFWSQSIDGAIERLHAMNLSMSYFRRNRLLLKELADVKEELDASLKSYTLASKECSDRLLDLGHASAYSLRLILSTRKDFPLRQRFQNLIKAAADLAEISSKPTFTESLSTFATLAFDLGLSLSSPDSAVRNLIEKVEEVTGHEYDRLLSKLTGPIGEMILDQRVNSALTEFANPCSDLGFLFQEAISLVCPVTQFKLVVDKRDPPIITRISSFAFLLFLFVVTYQIFLLVHIFFIFIQQCYSPKTCSCPENRPQDLK